MVSSKHIGTQTEMRFALAALERGAIVSEPIGDYAPYDLLVQPDQESSKIYRVQVKSATKHRVNVSRRLRDYKSGDMKTVPYSMKEIDFFVTQVEDVWYIIPHSKELTTSIHITPSSPTNKWKKYKEAWNLIKLPKEILQK